MPIGQMMYEKGFIFIIREARCTREGKFNFLFLLLLFSSNNHYSPFPIKSSYFCHFSHKRRIKIELSVDFLTFNISFGTGRPFINLFPLNSTPIHLISFIHIHQPPGYSPASTYFFLDSYFRPILYSAIQNKFFLSICFLV